MAFVSIQGVRKEFVSKEQSPVLALDAVDLAIRKGELVCLFGPNGCGKTTLLRILAGFEKPTHGRIVFGKKGIQPPKTYLVFQNPDDSLFPWLTVQENIDLFGSHKLDFRENMSVGGVSIQQLKKRFAYQLSGGQKQLAVLARALVYRPDLLLLDEPFSQLDFFSQRHLESVLLTAWNQHKPTVVLVSHDLEEAVFLSDRIAVFSKQPGRIVQVFDNPLPRPRQESHRFSRVFQNLKQRILHAVRDEK